MKDISVIDIIMLFSLVDYLHVFYAALIIVAPGKLLLFDAPFHIIIHPRGNHQSVLCPAVHRLGLHIVFLLLVLH